MNQNTIGVVYAANGPLAGVSVSAEPSAGGGGSGFAITDNSGHYSMTTGLTTGTYNVTTFANGYLMGERDLVSVTAGQTTTGINLDLQISGGISGTVTDADNANPINGTYVYAILSNGTLTFTLPSTTGPDGKYLIATNLPTGTYNVSIELAPSGYFRNTTTASVVAGVETKNVNIQLARSGIISGKVAAPNGTGLFGIAVSALSSDFTYIGTAQTDLSGNYRIATGLGTDNYTVSASGAGNSTIYGGLFTPTPVSVTAGQTTSGINMELTPVTTPPAPSGTITGRVTDQSNGNPIRSASVTATGSGGTGFGLTDSNGYYNISSGLLNGNDYNVSASASGYNDAYYSTLVSVTVGQTTSYINIQMTAKPAQNFGTITGTVTGAPNPIVPEFPYPMIEMLSLILATAVVGKIVLKTRRYKNKVNPP